MNKLVSFLLLASFAGAGVRAAGAPRVEIEGFTFDQWPDGGSVDVYPYPIDFAYWSVVTDVPLEPGDDTTAKIFHNGEVVASFGTSYQGHGSTGVITGVFDHDIILPKGNAYQVILPRGAYRCPDNHDIATDEHIFDFRVPAEVEFDDFQLYPDNHAFEGCYNSGRVLSLINTNSAGLYRDNELIENGHIELIDGEWGINQVYPRFSTREVVNGAHYSVVINEGAVSYHRRPDIVNRRLERTFIGGETGIIETDADRHNATISADGSDITLTGIEAGMPVTVHRPDGMTVTAMKNHGGTVTMHVNAPGLYIVKAGRDTFKIVCR